MKLRRAAVIGLITLVTAACTGVPRSAAKATPTASPGAAGSASSTAVPRVTTSAEPMPALGVLIAFPNGTGPQSTGYDLTLVAADGKVVARVHAAARSYIHTPGNGPGGAAAYDLPEVSASSSRVYYLDGDRDVRYLRPDGSGGLAARLPGTITAHAAFAVTPDDHRIAVSVVDYAPSPPTLRLYVEDLAGGNHAEIFSSASAYVWPVGWHQGKLVLAATSAAPFSQQGISGNPYNAPAYHVVDPADATRLATIGGDFIAGCQPLGLLTAAGTACYHRTATSGGAGYFSTLDWNGKLGSLRVATDTWGMAGIAPTDDSLAGCCDPSGTAWIAIPGSRFTSQVQGSPQDWPCFIDNANILFGFLNPAPNQQPQIMNARANMGGAVPIQVAASGFCAGILPAALN